MKLSIDLPIGDKAEFDRLGIAHRVTGHHRGMDTDFLTVEADVNRPQMDALDLRWGRWTWSPVDPWERPPG